MTNKEIERQLTLVMELNRRMAVEVARLWGMIDGPVRPVAPLPAPPVSPPPPPCTLMADLEDNAADDRAFTEVLGLRPSASFPSRPRPLFPSDRGYENVMILLRHLHEVKESTFNDLRAAFVAKGGPFGSFSGTVAHQWFMVVRDLRPKVYALSDLGKKAAAFLGTENEKFLRNSLRT